MQPNKHLSSKKRFALLLLVAICSLLKAQSPRVESLTISDGLSQGMIYDILQTRDGFLWFATKDGLNRYDGYGFKVFTNDPFNPFSIAGNEIVKMFEDSRGNFWLSVQGKGIDVLEKTSGKFLHLQIVGLDMTYVVTPFVETPDSTVVITTPNGIWKLRWKETDLNNPDLRASMSVNFEQKDLHKAFVLPTLTFKDSKGNQYVVEREFTKTGVYSIPADNKDGAPQLIYSPDLSVISACIDRNDNLWLGTGGFGLRKVSLSHKPFRHFIQGKSIGRIFTQESVLVQSVTERILFWKLDLISGIYHPTSLKGLEVSNYYTAKNGTTYVIADNYFVNYLVILKNGTIEQRQIDSSKACAFVCMVEDPSGDLWISLGDVGILMRFEPASGKITLFNLLKQFGNGMGIYALHLDAGQNLWVGTTNGMGCIPLADLKSGVDKFKIFQNDPANPHSLRYNFVSSFCPDPLDPERLLWVSTKGGGLNLLDKTTGEFQHFTSQNSDMPNDVVYGILPENPGSGNIWGSTNRGLFRLTVGLSEGKRSCRFRNFRKSDGLQDDEFNTGSFARAPDGHMYFGGINGVTMFLPADIEERQTDATVRLTGLKINNLEVDLLSPVNRKNQPLTRPIDQTESLRLDHTQNFITLEFALMDFQNPAENRFRYRLDGVDPDWVDAGKNHSANYTRLRSGHYLFEVQGSVAGGNWSAPTTLRITVLPPWWETWWAYTLYALIIGITVYAFYKIRLRQKLEHQKALRLQELDEFKSRFFTNITHEFRTPLTVILGTAEQVESKGGEELKGKMKLIRRNGQNLLRLINQILDLAKLESKTLKINYVQGDVLPYLRYVTESMHSLANAQNVMLRVESEHTKIDMDYDPERLLQMVYNLLSNAIKFTQSGGRVLLQVGTRNVQGKANLVLAVNDTGIGIPADDLPRMFDRFYQAANQSAGQGAAGGTGIGLSLTKELVKAMGGEISVESELGKGSTFTVRLPITNKAEAISQAAWSRPVAAEDQRDLLSPKTPFSHNGHPSLLIIEDNPDVVEYLVECLDEKYQLDYAYNGRVGIEKALESIPDLIVSDVMMPEKDGFEVCETLKNDERTSHIPIILLTAKADAASKITGLQRGADAYLAKPFDRQELLVQLETLHKKQQRMAAYFSGKTRNVDDLQLQEDVGIANILIEDAFIQKVRSIVAANYRDEDFGLPQLCQKVGMSRSQLFRKMTALINTSPSDFIRSYRLNEAKRMLETTDMNVSEVAWECGFVNLAHFSKVFQEEFGVQPSATGK